MSTRNAPRVGAAVARYARDRVERGFRAAAVGRCQQITRENSGTPPSGFSAAAAWSAAVEHGEVIRSANPADWPIGAAVMQLGGSKGYGHAMTYVGNGKATSTDWAGPRTFAYARVSDVARRWNFRTVGVILVDGNGYRIAHPIGSTTASTKRAGWYVVEHTPTRGYCYGRVSPSKRGAVKTRRRKGKRLRIVRTVNADGLVWGVTSQSTYYPLRNLRKV